MPRCRGRIRRPKVPLAPFSAERPSPETSSDSPATARGSRSRSNDLPTGPATRPGPMDNHPGLTLRRGQSLHISPQALPGSRVLTPCGRPIELVALRRTRAKGLKMSHATHAFRPFGHIARCKANSLTESARHCSIAYSSERCQLVRRRGSSPAPRKWSTGFPGGEGARIVEQAEIKVSRRL